MAVRHQGAVGIELVADALFLVGLFDAQHFLDLIADRQLVFEQKRDMLAEVHGTRLLVGHDLRAKIVTRLGVGFQRHQAVAGNAWHAVLR